MHNIYIDNIVNRVDIRQNLISIKNELKTRSDIMSFIESDNYDSTLFSSLLDSEDAKIRKNTALIMGVLGQPVFLKQLVEAYLEEKTLFIKSSYLKAIAGFDYSAYRDQLLNRMKELEAGAFDEADVKHIAEELHQLRLMFGDTAVAVKHVFREPSAPVQVILTARKEMLPYLLEEVSDLAGAAGTRKVFCGVMGTTARINELAAIRIYKDMLFPVNGMKAADKSEIAVQLVHGNLKDLLEKLHGVSDAPYRFRLSSRNLDNARIARSIEALSKGWLVNSVSDYEIELKLIENREGKVICLMKLYTRKDKRFTYRQRYVAASITPVNAASIVYLVKDYLTRDAQIIEIKTPYLIQFKVA